MTILPITLFGNPILRQKSKRVRGIGVSIQKLIDDMHETLEAAHGVGLAAPQVGSLLRVIAIHIPEQEPLALINPQVVRKRGERLVLRRQRETHAGVRVSADVRHAPDADDGHGRHQVRLRARNGSRALTRVSPFFLDFERAEDQNQAA
jgi:hypothetical protein